MPSGRTRLFVGCARLLSHDNEAFGKRAGRETLVGQWAIAQCVSAHLHHKSRLPGFEAKYASRIGGQWREVDPLVDAQRRQRELFVEERTHALLERAGRDAVQSGELLFSQPELTVQLEAGPKAHR